MGRPDASDLHQIVGVQSASSRRPGGVHVTPFGKVQERCRKGAGKVQERCWRGACMNASSKKQQKAPKSNKKQQKTAKSSKSSKKHQKTTHNNKKEQKKS